MKDLVRTSLTLPGYLHQQTTAAADAAGMSLSRYVSAALAERLERDKAQPDRTPTPSSVLWCTEAEPKTIPPGTEGCLFVSAASHAPHHIIGVEVEGGAVALNLGLYGWERLLVEDIRVNGAPNLLLRPFYLFDLLQTQANGGAIFRLFPHFIWPQYAQIRVRNASPNDMPIPRFGLVVNALSNEALMD